VGDLLGHIIGDGAERLIGEMGVALRHLARRMTQQLLNLVQRRALVDREAGERVPQIVQVEVLQARRRLDVLERLARLRQMRPRVLSGEVSAAA